jgi:hypothetical protein
MDPLEPWVDVAAVRRMAEQLMAESPLPRAEAAPDAGFGADFVGYGAAIPSPLPPVALHAVPPPLPPVQQTIAPSPPPVAVFTPVEEEQPVSPLVFPADGPPPAVVEPSPAMVERRGPLMDRLGRFREGLIRYTAAQGVFILDREGKPVMDDAAFGKLYFLARSLAQAYRPVAGQPGNVHVKINANLILEVIPVETPFGCLVLGAVVSQPLSAQIVAEIATALRRAATPGEANGSA